MRRLLPKLIPLAAAGVLCWIFPPFHVRSLKEVREVEADQQFDAAKFAEAFWSEQLVPAMEQAADAATVLDLIGSDPAAVREKFGRTLGLGGSYFLMLRGEGRVVSADEDRIGLSLEPDGDEAQLVIEPGFVFGNAVRDATGLIDPSSYPNAQEFNEISEALNAKVESEVMPELQRIAKVGERLRFAGCAEVADEDMDLDPLLLVPILVEAD